MTNPYFNLQGPQGSTRPDNLKMTKSALKFGPLSLTRVNTVPPMTYGRPGDVVLIDNTDAPSDVLQTNQNPTVVGMWMKLPLGYDTAPKGNTVTGFPQGYATAGDVITINAVIVFLAPPYDVDAVAADINGALIPNIVAQAVHGTLIVSEITGGAIAIANSGGTALETLGLYSQMSIAQLTNHGYKVNGVWMPVGYVAAASGTMASAASSYLTVIADPSLPNSRRINNGVGIKITDGGSGGTYDIEHDIATVPAIAEPVDPTDALLIHNQSTGLIERTTVADVIAASISGESINKVSGNIGIAGSINIGTPIPATAIIKTVLLDIQTPYSIGTSINVGTVGLPTILAPASSNDPEGVYAYETTPLYTLVGAEQIVVTITGSPAVGSGQVIIEYILP